MQDHMLEADIAELGAEPTLDALADSTIFVTGATGLIGSLFVKGLLRRNDVTGTGIRVLALARNPEKAAAVFDGLPSRADFRIVEGSATALPEIDEPIHWISHGASMTSSADFAAHPVEVASTELDGTRAVLELARAKQVRGMVYLSSLEAYGTFTAEHGPVREADQGPLDHLRPRNSYPAAKRMGEALCAAYASEYGVPVKIARLAQTFGAGVAYTDRRVFADFAKKIIEGADVVMHTEGAGRRCYCYTADAVTGLVRVMTAGAAGEAYNVSNPATYCSVREMAEMLVARYPESGSALVFDIPEDVSGFGYAEPSCTKLDSSKLQSLGWSPKHDLPEMYDRLLASLRSQRA